MKCVHGRRPSGLVVRLVTTVLAVWLSGFPADAEDNGIHVGKPKVYDSRALQLMMDDLARSLRNTSFIDPKALAAALGNTQGYSSQDFSQALNVSGAAGPQAAATFAAASGGASPASASAAPASSPTVSINVAPTLNAGPAAPASGGASGFGPAAPALPAQLTAPAYNPTFGPSGADLLSDEANLTYQLFNLRMMLERSLSDRLYDKNSRLQAVLGFDIDVEPERAARDAAAIVEVTVTIDCRGLQKCDDGGGLSLVAIMPEEGSHNAATLSQKSSAFGGALVANVFSVGYAAQKRSQVFYLYRDMDTLAFQNAADSKQLHFGWQFRPVLGRRTVAPGKRHMLVVVGLPAPDLPNDKDYQPNLVATVKTSWKYYDRKLQAVSPGRLFSHTLPSPPSGPTSFTIPVPNTAGMQSELEPCIDRVTWVPTDGLNGVAIVSGKNFFPGTTVRFGNKTYANAADGLIIKSDQQLEVAVPTAVASLGGVLSGRYGGAKRLEASIEKVKGFYIKDLYVTPAGNFLYYAAIDLMLSTEEGATQTFGDVLKTFGQPLVLVNGVPVNMPNVSLDEDQKHLKVNFTAPLIIFSSGAVVTVTFPFGGITWAQSMPYYDTTLKVTRLGGETKSRLLIAAADPGTQLCKGWTLVLDPDKILSVGKGLTCDEKGRVLIADVETETLNKYKRFALMADKKSPLTAEIPKADGPSPKPSIDPGQKVAELQNDMTVVTFTGKYLDKVTKVLLDKAELQIVKKAAGTIVISVPKDVTDKPRSNVSLQLLSEGNDPVLASFKVDAIPSPKGK